MKGDVTMALVKFFVGLIIILFAVAVTAWVSGIREVVDLLASLLAPVAEVLVALGFIMVILAVFFVLHTVFEAMVGEIEETE